MCYLQEQITDLQPFLGYSIVKRNILDIVDVDNSTTKIIASCCLPAKKGKIRIRKHEQLQQEPEKKTKSFLLQSGYGLGYIRNEKSFLS